MYENCCVKRVGLVATALCFIFIDHCFICGDSAGKECSECISFFASVHVVYFCEECSQAAHVKCTNREGHVVKDVVADAGGVNELDLLSVICIETSHYICFTRSEDRWVFFDSMADRVSECHKCCCAIPSLQLTRPGNKTKLIDTIIELEIFEE